MTLLRRCAAVILAAALACGATTAAAEKPAADKPAKKSQDDEKSAQDSPPSCLQCGATCGLRPICVCKPATKTVPEPEFSTTCEPICIPGCGSKPWPWCRHGRSSGCTSCTACVDEPCACPGRVRQRKVLVRKTVDSAKPVVKHSVGYVCCRCEAAQSPRAHACCPPRWQSWCGCFDWISSLWRH
jgi:hypothetical protein